MQLEDYFDFFTPNDVRVKGTRVGIESILYEYIHRKLSAEEILPQVSYFDFRASLCNDFVLPS